MENGEFGRDLMDMVRNKLSDLEVIWDELGIPRQEIEIRRDTVREHVENLLSGMYSEENQLLQRTKQQIIEYKREIENLSKALGLTANKRKVVTGRSMLRECHNLKSNLEHLRKICDKRKAKFASLTKQATSIASELAAEKHVAPNWHDDENVIPSQLDLEALKQQLATLQNERSRVFELTRNRVRLLMDELDILPPEGSSEHLMITSGKNESLRPDDANMKSLKRFERKLLAKKEERTRYASELERKVEIMAAILGVVVSPALKSCFGSLKPFHVTGLEFELDSLATRMNNREKRQKSAIPGNSKLAQPTLIPKLRRRSISTATISGTPKSRTAATPVRRHLTPFRFGMCGADAAWLAPATPKNQLKPLARLHSPHFRTISL